MFSGKNTTWKKVLRLGSAFLAGAFVFWEKHDLEIVGRLGSAFLAGAFVFWENHDLEKVLRLGSAFLAGAFVFWENHDLEKVLRHESAFPPPSPLPPIHAVSLTLRISDPSSDPAPLGDPPLFRELRIR